MLSPFRPALVEHEGVRFFVRPTQEADRSEYQRVLETQRSPLIADFTILQFLLRLPLRLRERKFDTNPMKLPRSGKK